MATGRPAQELIPIKEVRDDVLLLNNGSLRVILMASSINFALKSQAEQQAIIAQYQFFLNTLDFSIQFFIQSSALDIQPYLATLYEREKEQTNELLKIQTHEYTEFVKTFVETARIMSKTFYISIPYTPMASPTPKGFIEMVGNLLSGKEARGHVDDEQFSEYKNQLWQRVDVVTVGLARLGVHVAQLKTEELIELFYRLYNPGEFERGKISEAAGS